MKFILLNACLICLVFLSNVSCNKYLDEKPNSQLYVPNTWEDLQALLDHNTLMNFQTGSALIELISDNLYITDQRWSSAPPDLQAAYIWDDNKLQFKAGWSLPYTCVYTSNVVLENLHRIKDNSPIDKYNNLEGSALFYRSLSFFYLLQLYSKPYSEYADNDLGIVLKLSGSVTDNITRSPLKRCYSQIIEDLIIASKLLPSTPESVLRPSSIAAKALLARIYLSMSDYTNAKKYAKLVIQDRPRLLDFNSLLPGGAPVLPLFLENPEVIFADALQNTALSGPAVAIIDSFLYRSYEDNDLRKKVFFTTSPSVINGHRFKGSYHNISNSSVFFGLAIDEMYLILIECLIRENDIPTGLEYLNDLLRNRYVTGEYQEINVSDQSEVLDIVLKERRKEMIFRGTRWTDLRRLNLEGKNISLQRKLNDKVYVLPPNDPRSILLIPIEEIIRSGITQNKR